MNIYYTLNYLPFIRALLLIEVGRVFIYWRVELHWVAMLWRCCICRDETNSWSDLVHTTYVMIIKHLHLNISHKKVHYSWPNFNLCSYAWIKNFPIIKEKCKKLKRPKQQRKYFRLRCTYSCNNANLRSMTIDFVTTQSWCCHNIIHTSNPMHLF